MLRARYRNRAYREAREDSFSADLDIRGNDGRLLAQMRGLRLQYLAGHAPAPLTSHREDTTGTARLPGPGHTRRQRRTGILVAHPHLGSRPAQYPGRRWTAGRFLASAHRQWPHQPCPHP
ncbi:hypothetical protein AB0K69_04860 [Streptomyces umbrinus]